jgi:hypothetical protein
MPLSLLEFVTQWKASTLSERAGAHFHFNDLCDVLLLVLNHERAGVE